MPNQYFDLRGAKNAKLHVLVSEIEQQLARMSSSASQDDLRASFAKLVATLALEPLPDLRDCPICKHVGMRSATRCSYCWTALVPQSTPLETSESVTRGSD